MAATTVPAMAPISPTTPGTGNRLSATPCTCPIVENKSSVIDLGYCFSEHDCGEHISAVYDSPGEDRDCDESETEVGHAETSVSTGLNEGMTPTCWNRSSRLSSSQCSTNMPSSMRQMSMERISMGLPVGEIP